MLPAIALATLLSAAPAEASLQQDTALSADMQRVADDLYARARYYLQASGQTFYALGVFVQDSGNTIYEFGPEHTVEPQLPHAFADSMRNALRRTYANGARVVGIIVDSIEGPFEQAVDGVRGPVFPRRAIAEISDAGGGCKRIERSYRFVADTLPEFNLGRVVFDEPVIRNCGWTDYWAKWRKPEPPPPRPTSKTALARRALSISSEGAGFHTIGRFSGRLAIYEDSLVVVLDSLLIWRQRTATAEPVTLDSISLAVGQASGTSWSPVNSSAALKLGRLWRTGDRLLRRNLRFVLPHARRKEDFDAWIVVEVHLTRDGTPAWVYAHSKPGILRAPN